MPKKEHRYAATIAWTGNRGTGTSHYTAYSRDHDIRFEGKAPLPGSSDPAFRGDPTRYNPEELLLAALSSCHMLWYLHLCAANGIIVTAYADRAEGVMAENADGSGEFTRVVLHPEVTIAKGDAAKAEALQQKAGALCYIARSVNFPVAHEAVIKAA